MFRSWVRWGSRSLKQFKPETSPSKQSNAYLFGKFSQLLAPKNGQVPKLGAKDKVKNQEKPTLELLKIFPTVRQAMETEIRARYNLRLTYVNLVDEVQVSPSPIQCEAIPKLNQSRKLKEKGSDSEKIQNLLEAPVRVFTIAAETGLGKTWAYLGGVLSKLKQEDYQLWSDKGVTTYQNEREKPYIRLVIMVPTNELVEQVYETLAIGATAEIDPETVPKQYRKFAQLEPTMGLSIFKWLVGVPPTELFEELGRNRVDVLVTTPGKITGLSKLKNIARPFRYFSNVLWCVCDEADTLFDQSWLQETSSVVTHMNHLQGLVLCLATIPKEFTKTLDKMFPNKRLVVNITSKNLHMLPRQVEYRVIDASEKPYNNSPTRALVQCLFAIETDGTDPEFVKRVVVFVNEKSSAKALADKLITKYNLRQRDVVTLTGEMNPSQRQNYLEPFTNWAQPLAESEGLKMKILITTDLMARGINFRGVKNVVLYELPKSLVDLVHRVGRTGRMRQAGRVFLIVDRKTKRLWAKGLPKAVKNGKVIA